MKLTINKRDLMLKICFFVCSLYVLMRPFVTNYVTIYYKYLFILIVSFGLLLALLDSKNLRRIGGRTILRMLVFYVYIVINSMINGGFELFRYSFERYIFYTFPLFLMPAIQNRLNWDTILKGLSIFGTIDALVSIVEFVTKKQMFPMSNGELSVELSTRAGTIISRTYGLQGNYFLLAEILCVCGLSAFYLFLYDRKVWTLIAFFVISVGILTTGTRGYYVAFAIGVMFLFIFNGFDNGKMIVSLFRTVLIGFCILIILYVIVISGIQFGNQYIDDLLMRIRMVFDWTVDSANKGRLSRWNWAISMWRQAPLFGHGACFTDTRYSGFIAVTESGVLKRLVELGLIGTVLQYGTMIPLLIKGIKRYKKKKNSRYLFFFSVLLAFFVEDFVLQRYTAMEYTIITWISLAYLAYYDDDIVIPISNYINNDYF